MEREENYVRELPIRIRDPQLQAYMDALTCRLAGDLCADIRVYVLRLPYFNATMAPNGMMQIYSGLLLRCSNEAQLAAVLAHEISHYRMRHSLNNWRRTRATADALLAFSVIGGIGNAGAVGYLISGGVAGATLARFSRDQEAEADRLASTMLADAGYDLHPVVELWQGALAEEAANPRGFLSAIFADHPPTPARIAALAQAAGQHAGSLTGAEAWQAHWLRHHAQWLDDEVGRRNHLQSEVLLQRLLGFGIGAAQVHHARGESLRLRAGPGDLEAAASAYRQALDLGAPASSWRQLGLVLRRLGRHEQASSAFAAYLKAEPQADDRALIESYR